MDVDDGLVYEFRGFAGHKFEGGRLKFCIHWTEDEFTWEDIDNMGNVGEALVDYHGAYLDVCYAALENNSQVPNADAEFAVERITGARFEAGRLQYLVKRANLVKTWTDIDVLSGPDMLDALRRFHDSYFEVLDAFIDADGHGPADDDVAIIDYE